jgi:hypothetical protein
MAAEAEEKGKVKEMEETEVEAAVTTRTSARI